MADFQAAARILCHARRAWPAAAHIRRTGQRRQRVRQGREFSVRPRRCRLLRSSLLRETAARQVQVCFVGLLLVHHMALAANHGPATAPRGTGARLPEFVWWGARADGVLAGFTNSAQFRPASLVHRRRQEDGRDAAQVKQTARHRFSRHTPTIEFFKKFEMFQSDFFKKISLCVAT